MSKKARTKGKDDYIFPRGNRWYLKLQAPKGCPNSTIELEPYCGHRVRVIALGTEIYDEAVIAAAPYIQQHNWHKMIERNIREKTGRFSHIGFRYPPGLHMTADGEQFSAEGGELTFYDKAGKPNRKEPNPRDMSLGLSFLNRDEEEIANAMDKTELERRGGAIFIGRRSQESQKWVRDDAMIETYISHANLDGYFAKEAREVWSIYKERIGKPIAGATRDDGRALARYFLQEIGNKSATAQKKVGWLNAAVNLAIDDGKLNGINPFSKVVPKIDDASERVPLDDEDMAKARANLSTLSESDQLLWILLATTGMRLGEAFEIDRDMTEGGRRYVKIGTKTPQSKRRVPLPFAVTNLLPARISGPLFNGGAAAASKRLNRFISACGISDPNKVLHSLRHRAKDRLRAVQSGNEIQDALFGHNKKTVADGYGEGFPMTVLGDWAEKIGY